MGGIGIGKLTERQFWQHASAETGARVVSPDEHVLSNDYAAALTVRTRMYELIDKLKSLGIKLAVLSDTIESHVRVNQERGLFSPFDVTIFSNEVHMRKPDPKIFELTLERLGVDASETIFIDDRVVNVEAARRLGIRSIHCQTEDRSVEELDALLVPKTGGVANIFLVGGSGELLLQRRDRKPGISNPSLLTGWGGAIEEGETPLVAALRGLTEETNLRPAAHELAYFCLYHKTMAIHHENNPVWYFLLRDVDPGQLEVFEGQGFEAIASVDDLRDRRMSMLIREVVADYFLEVKSRKEVL